MVQEGGGMGAHARADPARIWTPEPAHSVSVRADGDSTVSDGSARDHLRVGKRKKRRVRERERATEANKERRERERKSRRLRFETD